jgi:hypothetical protein
MTIPCAAKSNKAKNKTPVAPGVNDGKKGDIGEPVFPFLLLHYSVLIP